MWFDYLRVDNEIADKLMNPANPNHSEVLGWIEGEAVNIARTTGSPWKFYIEEFDFNNIPCMTYLNRLLKSYNNEITLMCDLNYSNYNAHIPFKRWGGGEFDSYQYADHIKRFLLDSVGSTEIFMGSYPFGGYAPGSDQWSQSPIPYSLCGDVSYNEYTGMLTDDVPVTQYDTWLENHFNDTYHKYWSYNVWTKLADTLSRKANIPFINYIQTHVGGYGTHRNREPLNEEIKLITNLAISYGAKGSIYYLYRGYGCLPWMTPGNINYERGLVNPDPGNSCEDLDGPFTPRYTNIYGQTKWKSIIENNKVLNKWGPELISFSNDRKSYVYSLTSERNDMMQQSYINDVFTYKYIDNSSFSSDGNNKTAVKPVDIIEENSSQRYVQVANFEKSTDDGNNYFMIINRRCSPHYGLNENPHFPNNVEYGGLRQIKVSFNPGSGQLSGYDYWDIIDIENPLGAVMHYHKGDPFIDLGNFEPGQGKLYKMIPAPGSSNAKTTPNNLPTVYRLSQNYPNPFNPVTKVNYDLPRDAKVTIVIYDILGREVKRLVNNELKKAGTYLLDFNAQNYASGVYFYRMEAEETNGAKFTDSKKMVLLK